MYVRAVLARPDRAAGEGDVRLDGALDFLQALWALDHVLQSASKRMERELGLTGPQRLVLRIVAANPRIGAGPLARTLHLHPSTLTGVLRRLEEQRLLKRLDDPADARRALFTITPQGARLVERKARTVESAVSQLLRTRPAGQIATVRAVLADLTRALARYTPGS